MIFHFKFNIDGIKIESIKSQYNENPRINPSLKEVIKDDIPRILNLIFQKGQVLDHRYHKYFFMKQKIKRF